MDFRELLDSYDQVDQEYKARFPGIEAQISKISADRKTGPDYMSFIPSGEEAEKILLAPLRKVGLR